MKKSVQITLVIAGIISFTILVIPKDKPSDQAESEIVIDTIPVQNMWEVAHFVDDFGDPTDKEYVRNKQRIRGSFSNTATQNAPLDVSFLITDSTDIAIMLYEYAGTNPVKERAYNSYIAMLKDGAGEKYRLSAYNSSDRLSFNQENSGIIHKALKTGSVQFVINETENQTTEYKFSVANTDFYSNVYGELTQIE